jgi:dethiobiotin synthetase
MKKGYFITGTDTNAGKTWTTLALMHAFKKQGKSIIGMKPVASGCRLIDGKLKNDDALLIQQRATLNIDYDLINPYAYELPVSPHLAGKGNPVDMSLLLSRFNQIKSMADIVLVEGAGGWYSPVNDSQDISDLVKALDLPVILTVAIRLGCINHAKLTAQAIRLQGLNLAGWIAVCSDPNIHYPEENIDTISKSIDSHLLGTLPYLKRPDFDLLAEHLDLNAFSG